MSRRIALMLGSSHYENGYLPDLPAVENDLAKLGEVLEDKEIGDYQVTQYLDLPYHRAGEELGRFLRQAGRDDVVMVYFSGHGVRDRTGELHLAFQNSDPTAVEDTCLSASRISRHIDNSKAAVVMLILDSCFSGSFTRLNFKSSDPAPAYPTPTGTGRIVIASSSGTERSFVEDSDDPSSLSTFTSSLVRGLKSGSADVDGDGSVSPGDLFSYLEESLRQSGFAQTPTFHASAYQSSWTVARVAGRPGAAWTPAASATLIGDLLNEYLEEIEEVSTRSVAASATIDTGISAVDRLCSGVRRGELLVVSGEAGARDLVMTIARGCGLDGQQRVVLLSLRDGVNLVIHRLIAGQAQILLDVLTGGLRTQEQWTRLARIMGRISSSPLEILSLPRSAIFDRLSEYADLLSAELDLIVIDDLPPAAVEPRLGALLRSLASRARESNAAVVASISERVLSVETRDAIDQAPAIHLSASTFTEFDREGEMELRLERGRYGVRGGQVVLAHQPHYARVVEIPDETLQQLSWGDD